MCPFKSSTSATPVLNTEDDERPVSGVFLPALSSADAYAREFELRVRILNLEHSAYFGSS